MADDLTTSLASGSIRFTGLGSGTDFDSMITKLIEIEQVRTKRLESWRSDWEAKSDAFDSLSSNMLSLKTSLDSMNTTDEFLTKNAVSSNTTALTATAGSTAEESTHQVDVLSLATNDMHMGSVIFSSPDKIISDGAAGAFVFTAGSRQVTVNVTSTTTLTQFASLINSDADNRNYVRASVVNDGSGYRLQIRGMNLGAGNDFIVDNSATSANLLTNFAQGQFIETQNAGNARLRVDGFPLDPPTPSEDILKATFTGKTTADTITTTDGTFKLAYDGTLYSVDVTAADTYASLAGKINTAVGFSMATAADVSGNVELTLTGEAGSDKQISIISSPGTTVGALQPGAFAQIQGATDGYFERSTNSISDIVSGVTMNLASIGSSTITTSLDPQAVTAKVQTFVDAVNSVLQEIKDQTQVTTVGENVSGSLLTGNYGMQMIQQKLKNILAEKGVGFDYDMDPLVSLGSVGITTDTSQGSATFGLLVFDSGAFTAALKTDPDAVARLFSADNYPSTKEMVDGVAVESSNFNFESSIKGITQAGEYSVSYTVGAGGDITSASINGFPASIDGTKIVATGDGNAARGLSLEVINLTAGTYSGSAQIKSGKTQELIDELKRLTDSTTGTLEVLKDNYQDIMDSIDDKIAYEERRLALLEKNLRLRFANLEAVLGTYDNISTQLSSQISSLSSKS
ncbi:flagellar filament capping protein FliD [Desulfomicrobium baculatum]|uniref:Flagellar hook-associated protein 2 n=1 Tax=Desulfomicrobium baculatum (strain DSM 4028 / VKM B-1378 / X) TaxID=525897 RepID=C7LR59_DESBD|nr:flagellar filament capping protein FliD [Desulfomicrobium baculatum]ACU90465.1 flagellar hook-associated 2 domain protein [Desulfomicrobium baculatum DSM 4028]